MLRAGELENQELPIYVDRGWEDTLEPPLQYKEKTGRDFVILWSVSKFLLFSASFHSSLENKNLYSIIL